MEPVDLDAWLADKQLRRRQMIGILLSGSRIRRRPRDPGEVEVLIKLMRARRERWKRQGILVQTGPHSYELSLKDEVLGE